MKDLDFLYKQAELVDGDWRSFADVFLKHYSVASPDEQLRYIRALTTKWRNNTLYTLLNPHL